MNLTTLLTRGKAGVTGTPGMPRSSEVDILGNLIMAQGLPERTLISARDNSWTAQGLVANHSTFLVAQPTTAFAFALFNPDLINAYVIDRAFLWADASMAAAQPAQMFYALVPPSSPIPTFTGTLLTQLQILSLSGLLAYSGKASVKVAGACTAIPAVTAANWFPLGQGQNLPMTTNLGFGLEAQVQGRIVVKPGCTLLLNALAGTAATTFLQGCDWHEVPLALS